MKQEGLPIWKHSTLSPNHFPAAIITRCSSSILDPLVLAGIRGAASQGQGISLRVCGWWIAVGLVFGVRPCSWLFEDFGCRSRWLLCSRSRGPSPPPVVVPSSESPRTAVVGFTLVQAKLAWTSIAEARSEGWEFLVEYSVCLWLGFQAARA
ncbi:hypothetical protein Droror1_Dr00009483 [Drosera rotundifolia]